MTATNHALSGALIGAFLPLPIAVPLAFASHFILDALPHYGIARGLRDSSRSYRAIVLADVFVALSIGLAAIVFGKWRMEITGWVAYSPDITWVVQYARTRSLDLKDSNWFTRFHHRIQRYESQKGLFVELALFAALLPLFIMQILS